MGNDVVALWHAEALKRLPEHRAEIDRSRNVMALWSDLFFAFGQAYKRQPPDEAFIARVYNYADWCLSARPGLDAAHDPRTAVAVAFYEDIPGVPAARADMPRWFTMDDIKGLAYFFTHGYGRQGYLDLLSHVQRNGRMYVPRPRP